MGALKNAERLANSKNFHSFVRHDSDQTELQRVFEIADSLHGHLNAAKTVKRIASVNTVGKASQEIQACIVDHAVSLGFQTEKRGLFSKYETANLRPDYYLKLGPKRGIILEVERGKTLANNMDLLDLWKSHICDEAHYLFLIVPNLRPTQNGRATKVFPKVVERMAPFFVKENYVNVDGLFIFGY